MANTAKKKPSRKATSYSKEQKARQDNGPVVLPPKESNGTDRILNCLPSREPERDYTLVHARAAGIAPAADVQPPSELTLHESWWDIGEQGSTGSCVGWALADSVLRYLFVKAGRLNEDEKLSVRFIWTAAKERDEFVSRPETFIETAGTSLKAALDIARFYGCVRDNVLPFDGGGLFEGEAETFYSLAALFKISQYHSLINHRDSWKGWLVNKGPIMIRVEIDRTWTRATFTGGFLEFFNPFPSGLGLNGGHAAAIVGYDSDNFIIRNSWGEDWGNRGFGLAGPEYVAEAITEAYGVTL